MPGFTQNCCHCPTLYLVNRVQDIRPKRVLHKSVHYECPSWNLVQHKNENVVSQFSTSIHAWDFATTNSCANGTCRVLKETKNRMLVDVLEVLNKIYIWQFVKRLLANQVWLTKLLMDLYFTHVQEVHSDVHKVVNATSTYNFSKRSKCTWLIWFDILCRRDIHTTIQSSSKKGIKILPWPLYKLHFKNMRLKPHSGALMKQIKDEIKKLWSTFLNFDLTRSYSSNNFIISKLVQISLKKLKVFTGFFFFLFYFQLLCVFDRRLTFH